MTEPTKAVNLSSLKSNLSLEEEGTWVTMTGGWEAKVRSNKSRKYRAVQQRQLMRDRRFYARRAGLPPELIAKNALELVVDGLLVDWRYLVDDDGPIDIDRASEILGEEEHRDMLDDLADAGSIKATFEDQEEQEDIKN